MPDVTADPAARGAVERDSVAQAAAAPVIFRGGRVRRRERQALVAERCFAARAAAPAVATVTPVVVSGDKSRIVVGRRFRRRASLLDIVHAAVRHGQEHGVIPRESAAESTAAAAASEILTLVKQCTKARNCQKKEAGKRRGRRGRVHVACRNIGGEKLERCSTLLVAGLVRVFGPNLPYTPHSKVWLKARREHEPDTR